MTTSDPSDQGNTMSSISTSPSSTHGKEITSNKQDFTETKKSTLAYVTQTNTHLNYENTTSPFSEDGVTGRYDSTRKKRIYQPSTIIIIITVMVSLVILITLIGILVVKCKKYRRDQINRRRRNRIFREVGMIPMRSVVNEQYMGSEEG